MKLSMPYIQDLLGKAYYTLSSLDSNETLLMASLNPFSRNGMMHVYKASTKNMKLTMLEAKKLARRGGHTQSARAIIRGREDDIAQSLSMRKVFKNVVKWTGRTLLAIDVLSSWHNNYTSNSNSNTRITDSIVDTGYSLLKYGIGYGISLACSCIPGVGWIIGIGVSIGVDYLLDYLIEGDVLDNVKEWFADVGNQIENGWNQFWSFSWI